MDDRRRGSASDSHRGAFRFHSRQSAKRSFSTMTERDTRRSPSPLFVSPPPQDLHHHRPTLTLPPHPRTRYAGDGLDYRRPVTTAAARSSTVIDLTEEDDTQSARLVPEAASPVATPEPGPSGVHTRPRLPNFHHRNILDLESDVEHETLQGGSQGGSSDHHSRRQQHRHSPGPHYPHDIMDRPTRISTASNARHRRLGANTPRSVTPHPTGNTTIDLTADDDDEVVLTEVRPRVAPLPQLNIGRPEVTAGAGTLAGGILQRFFHLAGRPVDMPQHAMMVELNYMTVGFGMGGEPARPPTPVYEAPPAAKPGFTRSPGKNEEIVCPNCGDELCTGESEVKQQVWVVKSCGHAYCGECAQKRTKGKGKAKAVEPSANVVPPMKKCQVVDCGVPTSGAKAMLRVYVDG